MGIHFSRKQRAQISQEGKERTSKASNCDEFYETKDESSGNVKVNQLTEVTPTTGDVKVEEDPSYDIGNSKMNEKASQSTTNSQAKNHEPVVMAVATLDPGTQQQHNNSGIGPLEVSHGGYYLKKHRSTSSYDAMETVKRCWEKIEESLNQGDTTAQHRGPSNKYKGWKVIRLFVSSTFNDFYAERELLVKKVVPELKEWCESRKLHFIECDLRWGIPKDTTTEDTVTICLDELEKCRRETDGHPFFLSLLGERYGWIPDDNLLSSSLKDKYGLIGPISITHMEIVHGALRTKSPNAAFFIRDPSFIESLPPDFLSLFCDDSTLAKEHMKCLKSKLIEKYPNQVFDYKCEYEGTESTAGVNKVVLKDLAKEFAPQVIDFFKDAISKYQPTSDEMEETQDEVANRAQDTFIELRGNLVIGRDVEIQQVQDFLEKPFKAEKYGDEQQNADFASVLLVIGDPGMGKSSLLAKIVTMIHETNRKHCIYNFASAGINSTSITQVIERFTGTLRQITGVKETETRCTESEKLKEEFHKLLLHYSETMPTSQLVLVLDAVNQLQTERTSFFDWLPQPCPLNVQMIASSTVKDPYANFLRETYKDRIVEIELKSFDQNSGKKLVEARLGRYNKKLDESQLNALVSSSGAANPLWLSLTCEELRVHGIFETVSQKIASFPETIDDLLEVIVQRLVAEDTSGLVRDVLILLQCSMSGLTETDILAAALKTDDQVAMMPWAQCKRQLKFLLLNTGSRRDEETLWFFHNSVKLAVNRLFLSQDSDVSKSYHLKLADYFETKCSDPTRVALFLPNHLKFATELKRLYTFLRHDERSLQLDIISKQFFYQFIRCQVRHFGSRDTFATLTYMCHLCSVSRGAFSSFPNLNKDLCCVCGNYVAFKNDSALAYVCNRHKPFTAPGTSKCFVCQRVMFLNQKAISGGPVTMYLCTLCSNSNRCVRFDM